MKSFDTKITYDGKPITLHIDSANDRDILITALGATIGMALKTDIEYRKSHAIPTNQQTEYTVIQAHGQDYTLLEQGSTLMTKDEAAQQYDIINACNNELWTPKEGARVMTYAKGIINSREVKRGELMDTIDFKADFNGTPAGYPEQNPEGLHFIVNDKKFSTINIGGDCYQSLDAQRNYDEGLDKLLMRNVYDFSTIKP